MATRNKVDLVCLNNADLAYRMLGDEAGLFDDNGDNPDGDMLLREYGDFQTDKIDELVELKVAEHVTGWKVEPYTESSNYSRWCGYQEAGMAYFMDEDQAIACQNDEAAIEDSKA